MRRTIVIMAAVLMVAPSWAQCCRSQAAADEVAPATVAAPTLAELEHQAGVLRWELHDLNYSDIATTADKAAKRAELERVHHAIERLQQQQATLNLEVAAGLQQRESQRTVSLLAALLPAE